jgi:uncharacterized protein YyaL (SSP411 family)
MNANADNNSHKYNNHLINESSPYLLSHAHNPVDWYPWGKEALEKAKHDDKPIFLSIGYAACHWCHVMEKESFENEEIASILNENYIAIKVDREQRPDIDQIYMQATMAMTGSGGWPLSVFLTPQLKPFFAGTYFPPENGHGRPGFKYVITELAGGFRAERNHIDEIADKILYALKSSPVPNGAAQLPDKSSVELGYRAVMNGYDSVNGGFGMAPKFLHPIELSFLLKWYSVSHSADALSAVEKTLKAMAYGGIYDQLGGGFHRYSTDGRWLVPHFEKMLYDNALLAVTYGEAYQITKNEPYRQIVEATLDFILREMTDKSGGFYSSLDADSEGEEGKYYVWTKSEIDAILGKKADIFCKYFNVSEYGNFENNTNILNVDKSSLRYFERTELIDDELIKIINELKHKLFDFRSQRVRPLTDDKILISWNGLAISAFCKGYQIIFDDRYKSAAIKAALFIKENMIVNGGLIHSYRDGATSRGEFLEDYAYFMAGLIDLYETVHDYRWIELAVELSHRAMMLFSDDMGNLFLAADNPEEYYIRPKDIADGALPAPGSILIQALIKLGRITGQAKLEKNGGKFLMALSGAISGMPQGMISAFGVLVELIYERNEIVVVGTLDRENFLRKIYQHYIPNGTLIVSDNGSESIPLLEGRKSGGQVSVYICRNFICQRPITDLTELGQALTDIAKSE